MDEPIKKYALQTADKMQKFIGYHESLRGDEAINFFIDLERWPEDNFLEMGLALNILTTDREFLRLHFKRSEKVSDWTKYGKPATVNAFYNSKDNSIQFPAAILQRPNFDKNRPASMNFGAIGSIMGHEITHAFDDIASSFDVWSNASKQIYQERVECLVTQYSKFRVPEIEEFFKINEFHLNGNLTQKEDIADCGGVKLALRAFRNFSSKVRHSRDSPVGFENFSQEQLFYLSFAQTFCSVERPAKMKNNVETDVHSLNRFRVLGPLSNMLEFATAWHCPAGSLMNPLKKCAVW